MNDQFDGMGEEKRADESFGTPDTGVPAALACMVSYFIPVFGGVFFLFVERSSKLIRFHAAQSIMFWILFVLLQALAGVLGSEILGRLIAIILLISWGYLLYESLMEQISKFPVIGDLAYSMIFDEHGRKR